MELPNVSPISSRQDSQNTSDTNSSRDGVPFPHSSGDRLESNATQPFAATNDNDFQNAHLIPSLGYFQSRLQSDRYEERYNTNVVWTPSVQRTRNLNGEPFAQNFSVEFPFVSELSSSQVTHPNSRRCKPIPINKWNLTFNGEDNKMSPTDKNVREFIFELNVLKQSQNVSDGELLAQINSLLTHTARTWYFANYEKFRNWNDFVTALFECFLPNYSWIDALSELASSHQKKSERPLAYFNRMILSFRISPIMFSELEKVDMIQKNLCPDIQMAVAPWQPRTIKRLEQLLTLMETNHRNE